MILAENLRKTLGGREVVNLTFHVEPGSVTGLVGPNGAGKTVTIKMISGILRKSSGKLEVFGQDPWNNPRVHERMSVIFATPFYPREIKVGELLRDLGKLYGRDPRELTEEFQLTPHLQKRLNQLSSGLLQRVQLVASLMKDPELLVADEPTSNLDPTSRLQFQEIMKRLNGSGVTILISSHILSELERLVSHVIFISRGEATFSGRINDVLKGEEEIHLLVDDPERALKVLGKGTREGGYLRVMGNFREIVDLLDDAGVKIINSRRASLDEVFKKFSSA